jgi:hypothetical protein
MGHVTGGHMFCFMSGLGVCLIRESVLIARLFFDFIFEFEPTDFVAV